MTSWGTSKHCIAFVLCDAWCLKPAQLSSMQVNMNKVKESLILCEYCPKFCHFHKSFSVGVRTCEVKRLVTSISCCMRPVMRPASFKGLHGCLPTKTTSPKIGKVSIDYSHFRECSACASLFLTPPAFHGADHRSAIQPQTKHLT